MQGQRSSVGSLSETINFEHESSSNNSGNQPVCWNNMWNPAENRIPDYLLPTSDINTGYISSVSHEQHSLSRWSLGESSSCDMQTEALPDEQKAELGWSSMSHDADGPVTENQLCEPSNNLSLRHVNLSPLIIQNSNSNALPHSLNLNASFVSHGGESSRVNEGSNVYKSSGSEEGRVLFSSASDPLLLSSGNSGNPVVANDGRAGSSVDGRRAPCKRKAIEGSVTQSSLSGSSNYLQHIESGVEPPLPVFPSRYNTGSRLTIPAPPRINQAPIRGAGELTSNSFSESIVAESPDSSQRNYRIRFSSSNAQDSFVPAGTTVIRHPGSSSSQLPARVVPAEYVLDLRPTPVVDNISAQGQPIMIQMPALPRTIQPTRWTVSSTSRSGGTGGSSSSVGERQAVQREEVRPSNIGRNISEHPMFVPANELRNLIRNPPNRGLTSSNLSIPGNVASTSRVGSSSGVRPSSGPWMPPENSPTQFPRRLTEYVRRQLFSSATNEAGGRTSNYSQRSGSIPAQDMVLSSGTGRRGHHLFHPRSALLMERRGDSGIGLPHSLRTLASSGEGSDNNRLSEQIRNVLGLVRRGESLRVEDVMILDQSLFFGMADIYDRHRDMRLDVDNMSYEELLALEERIGNVNTGLNEETIVARLKQKKRVNAAESQVEEEPCCVCQEEYIEGEDIGILECGHDFHTHCIKQWLLQKNLCPICKTTGLANRE